MTSRYSINQQTNQSSTEFWIKDTQDTLSGESIQRIYIDFGNGAYSSLSTWVGLINGGSLSVDSTVLIEWIGADGLPLDMNTDSSSLVYGASFTNIYSSVSAAGFMLFSTSDSTAQGSIKIDSSGYFETFSGGSQIAFAADTGSGATTPKPAITFENLIESSGMLTVDIWLNELPDRTTMSNLEQIAISGVFGSGTPTFTQNTAITGTSNIEFLSSASSLTFGSSTNSLEDVLYAGGFTTTTSEVVLNGPVKLGTISVDAGFFGAATDGTGTSSTSGWEILDLGIGASTYGISSVTFNGIDSLYQTVSPISLPLNDILNYSASGSGTDTPTTPAGPTYQHIGNSTNTGKSGTHEDTSTYPTNSEIVEFYINSDNVLLVDDSTLHVDNGGSSGASSQEMGVFLDLGLGQGSTLLPIDNDKTVPQAAIIKDASDVTVHTLDGMYDITTETDVEDLPWVVLLTGNDDIFFGRGDVVDGTSATGYAPSVEAYIATSGHDFVDSGGGYNAALFTALTTTQDSRTYMDGVYFDMGQGSVQFSTSEGQFNQSMYDFQSALGTFSDDLILGTGMQDDLVEETMWSYDFGGNVIDYGAGGNEIWGAGGSDILVGQDGDDVLYLNQMSSAAASSEYGLAIGGFGDDLIALGLGSDDVVGGGKQEVRNYSDAATHRTMETMSQDQLIASEDYYNDSGADYVVFDINGGLLPMYVKKVTLSANADGTGTPAMEIDFTNAGFTSNTSWDEFVSKANLMTNEKLGYLDYDSNTDTYTNNSNTAYKFVEAIPDVNGGTSGIKIWLDQGLSAPVGTTSFYHEVDEFESAPTSDRWMTMTDLNNNVYIANKYAKNNEFIDGTGDDNDVFAAFAFDIDTEDSLEINAGIDVIDGDSFHDLNIGQNSLNLTSEVGEAIYFDTNSFTGVQDITVYTSPTGTMAPYAYVTLVKGDTINGIIEKGFYLENLNLPTSNLSGSALDFQLVATTKEVSYTAVIADVGVGQSDTETKSLTELRFEWQGVGEKVAANDSDTILVGSNTENTIEGRAGNDVLNGSGGDDNYHFYGDFGDDRIFENQGDDTLKIGARDSDVWFERSGRRGDELKITVNDGGTNHGTITIGRQFNPYTDRAAIENIELGYKVDNYSQTLTMSSYDNSGGNIKVLKESEEYFHVHADRDSFVYMNPGESSSATIRFDGIKDESFTYWDGYQDVTEHYKEFNFEIAYGSHTDEFSVKADTNSDGSFKDPMQLGEVVTFLNKNGLSNTSIETTFTHPDVSAVVNSTNSDRVDFKYTDDSGMEHLVFSLELEDASAYAV